jgi:hypothetical protein
MWLYGESTPATDSPIFRQRELLRLGIYSVTELEVTTKRPRVAQRGPSSSLSPNVRFRGGEPSLPLPRLYIEARFPRAARIRDDGAIDVSAEYQEAANQRMFSASVSASKEIELRTTQSCTPTSTTPLEACANFEGTPAVANLRWIVRASQPGVALFTLQLPGDLISSDFGKTWRITLNQNGRLLASNGRPYSLDDGNPTPLLLSADHPEFVGDYFEINMRTHQLTISTEFKTTLGVSSSTYDTMTIIGAITSGLLGGGWLWQFLPWLKGKAEKKRRSVNAD